MLGTAESRFNFWLRVTVSHGELSTRAATGWGKSTACLDRSKVVRTVLLPQRSCAYALETNVLVINLTLGSRTCEET